MTIGIAIPTIPGRSEQLLRALKSVASQTLAPDQVSIAIDKNKEGAAPTRNRAWKALDTEWVAFLDDDDELDPNHLEVLYNHAVGSGADLIFPWFRLNVLGQLKPGGTLVDFQGVKDELIPDIIMNKHNIIPVTVLLKKSMLEKVDGFPIPGSDDWAFMDCEDWGCWQRVITAGGKISHVNTVTWTYHHWGLNTSGRPDRW